MFSIEENVYRRKRESYWARATSQMLQYGLEKMRLTEKCLKNPCV
jgi:hypothetical protein